MKNSLIILTLTLLLATSCSKSDSTIAYPDPVQQKIISSILAVGSSGSNPQRVSPRGLALRAATGGTPFNQPLDFSMPGESGGAVNVTGNFSGMLNDDGSMSMTMQMNEAFVNYGIVVDSKTYTNSGNITYSGTMNTTVNNTVSARFVIGGSITTAGPGYNKQMGMDLLIVESMSGQNMTSTVSGKIGGVSVNYTYSMNQ